MLVKSVDLRDQKLLDVISGVLRSGQFINGPYVHKFAKGFAKYCGTEYCIPVSSGTDAIGLVLKAFKMIPYPGDKVIIPNLSFFSTASAVLSCGYTPIFCDVNKNGLLDVGMLNDVLDKYDDIACILSVNLYGQYVNIPQYVRDKVPVIDDACQAHGLFGPTTFVGNSKSLASCYSFYPSKNLGAIGDAGAVITDDRELYEVVRMLSKYGCDERRHIHAFPECSGNYRMDEIQAAVLCQKLSELNSTNHDRCRIVNYYLDHSIVGYVNHSPDVNVFHQYPILVDNRRKFINLMGWKAIDIGIHYPYILSDKVPGIVEAYSVSKMIADCCVSLPIGNHLTYGDLSYIVCSFNEIIEKREENMYIVKES